MIKLMPIDAVHASDYNPRKNDEKRLALTELSLRKLGFLLPIYADTEGEILSGHQRQFVARRMGYTQIPVEFVETKKLAERKAINILFNRATNDMQKQDDCANIKKRLYDSGVETLGAELPDIEPDTDAAFPCVYKTRHMTVDTLAKLNHRAFDIHICQLAKSLEKNINTVMPLVVTPDGKVINGIGRLQAAAEAKKKVIRAVVISEEAGAFASIMLNLLTMDFDMESTYADDLRYNSFMRERNTREVDKDGNAAFGDGFYIGVFRDKHGRDFFKLEGDDLRKWVAYYGNSVVDFGAGKLSNTRTLRAAGVRCAAFEPYFVTAGEKVHKGKSLEIAEKFLADVESGTIYDTVFVSSVFNSVPFMKDREQIAIIAAALCYPKGRTVIWCQSNQAPQFQITKKKYVSSEKTMTFDLNYEPNIAIGDIGNKPKVQKGHTEEELRHILAPCFGKILRMDMIRKFWYVEAGEPTINPAALAAALDFEFDLPYPDGTRMGMADRARAAFEHRLGIKLPKRGGADDAV